MGNYPSEENLQTIRTWDYQDLDGLMEFIRPLFEEFGALRREGQDWILATGGWSGNEDIINAIMDNTMVKIAYYYQWTRGGAYVFRDTREASVAS